MPDNPSITQVRTSQSIRVTLGSTAIRSVHQDNLQSSTGTSTITSEIIGTNPSVTVETTSQYILKETIGGVPLPTPAFRGFGFIRLADTFNTALVPLNITGGVKTVILNNGQLITDFRRAPFSQSPMLVNNRIYPVASGDAFLIRLSFNISSLLMSNSLTVQLDIGVVLQQHSQSFAQSSGDPELVTINFLVYAQDRFKTNGGGFYITTDQNASIWGVSMVVFPLSSGLSS